jgi:hypothetical protein
MCLAADVRLAATVVTAVITFPTTAALSSIPEPRESPIERYRGSFFGIKLAEL